MNGRLVFVPLAVLLVNLFLTAVALAGGGGGPAPTPPCIPDVNC